MYDLVQVLPFILHRTKAVVARDIPAKTIIDVLCPLSETQRQLYTEFLTDSRWTDAALETEFKALAGDVTGSAEGMPSALTARKVHPFQALHYLKLLCIHPSLVIDSTEHGGYRQRLVDELGSSTKMLHLADLLVTSGVVLREEASNLFDQMTGILQASLMGEKVSGSSSSSSLLVDDDEEYEESVKSDEGLNKDDDDDNMDDSDDKNEAKQQQVSKPPTTKRSTAKEAVRHACKISKSHSKATPKDNKKVKVVEEVTIRSNSEFAHKCLIFSTHKAVLDIVETVNTTHLTLFYFKTLILPSHDTNRLF